LSVHPSIVLSFYQSFYPSIHPWLGITPLPADLQKLVWERRASSTQRWFIPVSFQWDHSNRCLLLSQSEGDVCWRSATLHKSHWRATDLLLYLNVVKHFGIELRGAALYTKQSLSKHFQPLSGI